MKTCNLSPSALDLYLFKVECSSFRKIIQRETLPASCTDAAEHAVFPLRWWIHTGRASAQYLRAMLTIRPDYIACVLLRGGSDDEIIARLRSRIERAPAFRYNNKKTEEETTMTIRELARHIMTHADTAPEELTVSAAAGIISALDPSEDMPEGLTPGTFMAAWNDLLRSDPPEDLWRPADRTGPASVSLDNGTTYMDADGAIDALADPECVVTWDALANAMHDDIREQVAEELAPCTNLEFLRRYLELSTTDLIVG